VAVGKDLMFAVGLRRFNQPVGLKAVKIVGKDLMFAVGLRQPKTTRATRMIEKRFMLEKT